MSAAPAFFSAPLTTPAGFKISASRCARRTASRRPSRPRTTNTHSPARSTRCPRTSSRTRRRATTREEGRSGTRSTSRAHRTPRVRTGRTRTIRTRTHRPDTTTRHRRTVTRARRLSTLASGAGLEACHSPDTHFHSYIRSLKSLLSHLPRGASDPVCTAVILIGSTLSSHVHIIVFPDWIFIQLPLTPMLLSSQ